MKDSNFENRLIDIWNATIKEALAPYLINLRGGRIHTRMDGEIRDLYKVYRENGDEPKLLRGINSLLDRLNKTLDETLYPREGQLFLLPDFRVYRHYLANIVKEGANS